MEEISEIDNLPGLYRVKKVKILYECRRMAGKLVVKNMETGKIKIKTKEEIKNAIS